MPHNETDPNYDLDIPIESMAINKMEDMNLHKKMK